jgi:hypothetical protein
MRAVKSLLLIAGPRREGVRLFMFAICTRQGDQLVIQSHCSVGWDGMSTNQRVDIHSFSPYPD